MHLKVSLISNYRELDNISGMHFPTITFSKIGIDKISGKDFPSKQKLVIDTHLINNKRQINKFLESLSSQLTIGNFYIGCANYKMGYAKSKDKTIFSPIRSKLAFVFHRVLPKLPIAEKLYFSITKGRNRHLSKTEIFGRLYCCGFMLVDTQKKGDLLYFVAQKIKEPAFDPTPSYRPIFKMKRVGLHGKTLYIYKLRTMYPYAEYLQEYVYTQNQLKEGGKFSEDFRISKIGKFFRKYFLDEIPMLLNWIKGDLKLVGVRPISTHYLSLYSDELKELRHGVKPGLLPPYYADFPKTLEEIMNSEINFNKQYKKRPLYTDVKYFFRIVYNIVFKRRRSA